MSTKYELATELRALCRGTKPLPICRMKKHELEAEIDRLKILKGIPLPEYPAAKPGPVGPRPIKAETTEDGITVPTAPATRPVKKADLIVQPEPVAVTATRTTVKSLRSLPLAPKRSHSCNCPACPEKALTA